MGLLARNKTLHPFFDDSLFDNNFFKNYIQRPLYSNIGRYPIRRLKTDDATIKLQFDIPGMGKDDIEITYDEETEILSVVSKTKDGMKTEHTFSYQVSLYDIDTDNIEAQCDKGVLTVTAKPLTKKHTKKHIEIKELIE